MLCIKDIVTRPGQMDFEHVIGESDVPLPQDPVLFFDMVRRLREEKDQDSAPRL